MPENPAPSRTRRPGEIRQRRALEASRSRSARELMDRVIAEVQHFSIGEQADDLTLVIARAL